MRPRPLKVASTRRCEELLQAVFNLKPLEVKIYTVLVKEGPMRADEIAEKINRNRSTAYRCLRHLLACNMSYKEEKYLVKGGYFHLYHAELPEEVKKELEHCIADWHNGMCNAIEEFINKFEE